MSIFATSRKQRDFFVSHAGFRREVDVRGSGSVMSQAGILGFFVGIRARAWGSEKTNLLHFHFIEKNTDSLKKTDLGLEDHVKKKSLPKNNYRKTDMLEDHEKKTKLRKVQKSEMRNFFLHFSHSKTKKHSE